MSLPEDAPHSILAAATTSLPAGLAMMAASSTLPALISSSSSFPTTTAMLAIATAASNSTGGEDSRPGADGGECKLLGPFALFIQGALGILALLSLVFKRWRERPQRPVKIWAFDASKQVVGSALLHVANLLLSMISSGELANVKAEDYQANPCSFYLLNLAIDTTLGIPILIVLLKLVTYAFSLTPLAQPPESIQSGNYGRPPKTKWWLKQCIIYFIGLLGMKICVFVIFQLCPWIIRVGDWALRWTEGNQTLQIFFVMLFFPVVMNALQYYIIDSFIKDQKPAEHEAVPGEEDVDDDDDGQDHLDTSRRGEEDDDDDRLRDGGEEASLIKKNADATAKQQEEAEKKEDANTEVDPKKPQEYDPTTDGASSSGSGSRDGKSGDPQREQNAKEISKANKDAR